MRGKKAKRLRKLGLKSGPAPKPEPTEHQLKNIERRIEKAKQSYKNNPKPLSGYAADAYANARSGKGHGLVKSND